MNPWPSDLRTPNTSKKSSGSPLKKPNVRKIFEFKFVSASDITRIVSNLKNTKALGVDNIATEVWKKGIITLAGPIARLCNMSMASGVVPDLFKEAIVHPVFKGHKKNPRDPSSYRPVSILPAISKVLEIAVHEALLSWFNLIEFLPESQYGFLPRRSTTMALTVAQKDWIDAKSHKELVGVMAFDLSSAFDTLSHSTLLGKLEHAGITGVPLKWFKSYLSNRSQSVLWNSVLSKPASLDRGVPQGSILCPLLFLAMIHDMPKYLISDSLMSSSRVVGYADDTTVYAKSKSLEQLKARLQIGANNMVMYCNDNGLILNSQKTQILTTAKEKIEIKINQDIVSSAQSISLLGLEYDSNFSTAPYLKQLAREVNT